jgi:hypothetical protein
MRLSSCSTHSDNDSAVRGLHKQQVRHQIQLDVHFLTLLASSGPLQCRYSLHLCKMSMVDLMAVGFESSESFIIFYSNSMTKIFISIMWKIRINILDLLESSWFIIKPTIFEPGANSSKSVHMYAQVCIKMFAAVAISMISTHAPINMLTFWTHDHRPA